MKHELHMASILGILIAQKHFPCSSILKTLSNSGTPLLLGRLGMIRLCTYTWMPVNIFWHLIVILLEICFFLSYTGWLIFGINDIAFTDYLQHLCKDIYSHIVFFWVSNPVKLI